MAIRSSNRGSPPGPRILILGLPYFGEMLALELRARGWQAEFVPHPGRSLPGWGRIVLKLLRSRLLYLVGTRADRRSPQALLLRAWWRPAVVHWVGTDAQIARDEFRRGDLAASVVRRPVHWCDAPWLVEEVAEMGIAAEYVTLPVVGLSRVAPRLPAEFTVLLYLPLDAYDREVFDMETLLRLPLELPTVRFLLIPSPPESLTQPLPQNLDARGWVTNMDDLYGDVSVVVRLTSHDGTSFMVLEALSRGRYVIWTFPMTGATQAQGFEAVAAELRRLYGLHQVGGLHLNAEGMAFSRAAFAPEAAIRNIDQRLRRLLRRS